MRLQTTCGHRTNHTIKNCPLCIGQHSLTNMTFIPIEGGELTGTDFSLNKKKRWETVEELRKSNQVVEITAFQGIKSWKNHVKDEQEPVALAYYPTHKSLKKMNSLPGFKSFQNSHNISKDGEKSKSRGKGKGKNKSHSYSDFDN